MKTEDVADLQQALERALSVEPVPGFVARVRTRIANDAPCRQPLRGWQQIVLVGAGAVVCVMTVWMATANRQPPGTVVATNLVSSAVAVQPAPVTQPIAIAEPVGPRTETQATRAFVPQAPVEPTESRALVPDDQRIALIGLLRAIRAGRATVPATVSPTFDGEGSLVAPAPVVISPVTIEPPPVPEATSEQQKDKR